MRKFAMLVLLMMLGIGWAKAESYQILATGENLSYAAGSSGVWIMQDEEITYYPENGTPAVVAKMENVRLLAGEGETVYMRTVQEENCRILGMGLDGQVCCQAELPGNWYLGQVGVWNDTLYLMALPEAPAAGHDAGMGYKVYAAPLGETLDLQPIAVEGWSNGAVIGMAVQDGLLYTSKHRGELAVIDLKTNELAHLSASYETEFYQLDGKQLDNGVYSFFAAHNTGVYRYDVTNGEQTEEVRDLPMGCYVLPGTLNGLYVKNIEGWIARTVRPETSEKLVIANAGNYGIITQAAKAFTARYPDVEVVVKEYPDDRVVATHMLAGEIDILYASESPMTVAEYYKAGAIKVLNTYPEIVGQLDAYQDCFGCVSIDGQLMGVPLDITASAFRVNDRLLDQLGIPSPENGWTWQDFFALADQLRAYNAAAEKPVYMLAGYPYWMLAQLRCNAHDVMAGEAHYVREDYAWLLEEWKRLDQDGLVSHYKYPSRGMLPADVLFLVDTCVTYNSMRTDHYLLLPVFDESTRLPVTTHKLMINAKSDSTDLAAYFLSCCLDPDNLAQVYDAPNYGVPLKDDPRFAEGKYTDSWTEKNKQTWLDIMHRSGISADAGDITAEQQMTLWPQFMEGTLTAEEFLRICQQRANMVLGE